MASMRGSFAIALTGGRTPRPLYEALSGPAWRHSIRWEAWRVYFGDERACPPDDAASNYHMARTTLLDHVLIVNSGTVSSHRVRGYIRPSYNVIEVNAETVRVTLKYPGTGERMAGVLDRQRMALHTSTELASMFTKTSWRP